MKKSIKKPRSKVKQPRVPTKRARGKAVRIKTATKRAGAAANGHKHSKHQGVRYLPDERGASAAPRNGKRKRMTFQEKLKTMTLEELQAKRDELAAKLARLRGGRA